ncbi:MAG: class I SAM-dependent methyltransferase [Candidatus Sungbacteria bacterium]|nr:class I SAM-dependent methyltransferase [Candidatus Sungbacteria bacterium]
MLNNISTFRHRLDLFLHDPVWALKGRFAFVRRTIKLANLFFQLWAEYCLRKRGYLEFFKNRPPHALRPDYADLWFLYRTARRRKPKCIVEFGSGASTVILAQALSDNYAENPGDGGRLYSFDAEKEWADAAAKTMPARLRQFCEVSHHPVFREEYDGQKVYRHENIPGDIVPDLVYLDDPGTYPKGTISVDMLYVEPRLRRGFCMVIDGRREMTEFLRSHLRREYKFRYRRFFYNSVFELIA